MLVTDTFVFLPFECALHPQCLAKGDGCSRFPSTDRLSRAINYLADTAMMIKEVTGVNEEEGVDKKIIKTLNETFSCATYVD